MADQIAMREITEATRSRPRLPKEYGVPTGDEGLLLWGWVVERLETARNYWVCTTRPDGRPHAVPVWAGWVRDTLYFDGHPQTLWARNLANNPAITIHLESGDEVVILEGTVVDIPQLDRTIAVEVAKAFEKYGQPPSTEEWVERGLFSMRPQIVFAWSEFPRTMTRWQFSY